eukprot:g5829.t1
MTTTGWDSVTRDHPCSICGRPEKCRRSGDGAVCCWRETEPPRGWRVVSQPRGGGTVFRRGDDGPSRIEWDAKLSSISSSSAAREQWAELLGVPEPLLRRYGCRAGGGVLYHPEYGPSGEVCGLVKRRTNGSKISEKKSRRGLTLPRTLPLRIHWLLITEGASDCLATAAVFAGERGTAVIGRASKTVVDDALEFARRVQPEHVVVVADQDDADGGAAQLAVAVANAGIPAFVIVPPAKDIREWITEGADAADINNLINEAEEVEPTGAFAVMDAAEVMKLPPPEYLIERILPEQSLSVMWGQPGTGKTFVALAMAGCISSATPFFGHEATAGSVVYVAGEGLGGLPNRLTALDLDPEVSLGRVGVVARSPNLLDTHSTTQFIASIRRRKPRLVIIDTLARGMPGGDENSAQDMGRLIASADRIRDEAGCAVLLIHHGGKNTKSERGSSALRGAADVMIEVKGSRLVTKLLSDKSKDDRPFKEITLSLKVVELPNGRSSCRVELAVLPTAGAASGGKGVLDTIRAAGSTGITPGELDKKLNMPERSRRREVDRLIEAGQADTVAAELRRRLTAGEMGLGGPVSAAGAEAPEFSAYAWGFIERYAKVACKLNTWKSYETILRLHVEPGWRGRRLDEITRADVKRLLLTKQQEGLAPGTVQNIKAFVSGLFTHAYEDEILDRNPALRLGRFIQKDDRRKDIRPLTRDQAAALLGLAWADVDFEANAIEVRRSYSHGHFDTPKSHKGRRVDMSDQLASALQGHRSALLARNGGRQPTTEVPGRRKAEAAVQLVFPSATGGPRDGDNLRRRVFYRLLEIADVPRFWFHDIRHTFASHLLQQGESLHYVKEQLGHASIHTTVDVYGPLVLGSNRKAVKQLDDAG